MFSRTVSEVKIDQILVRHSQFGGKVFEIGNRQLIQADGNGLFELFDVRVFNPFHFRKIIMRFHRSPLVIFAFIFVCLPGGNQPDHLVIFSVTVADDQHPEFKTYTEHDESIFLSRMIGIEEPNCVFIQEDCLGFLERDSMLPHVLAVLIFIPFELNAIHVLTVYVLTSRGSNYLSWAERHFSGAARVATSLGEVGSILIDFLVRTSSAILRIYLLKSPVLENPLISIRPSCQRALKTSHYR